MEARVVVRDAFGQSEVRVDAGAFVAPCPAEGGLIQVAPTVFVNPQNVVSLIYVENPSHDAFGNQLAAAAA